MQGIGYKLKNLAPVQFCGILLKQAAVHSISFYQYFISPTLPACCRYNPTCSQYAKEAFSRYGIFKGFHLSLKRLLRCHPFAKGGDDFLR